MYLMDLFIILYIKELYYYVIFFIINNIMIPQLTIINQNYNKINIKTLSELNYNYINPIYSNYGLSEPFQLFTKESAIQLANYIKTLYDTEYEKSSKRTLACIRDNPILQKIIYNIKCDLEKMASSLVRLPMKLQLPIDYAHINIQKNKQTNPVDDWHYDSTPFVLVTILTDHQTDKKGNLLVGLKNSNKILKCKLTTPGEACLMQGNQIYHCAQQSSNGERISMVTSFYVDSPFIYDCSSLQAPIEYSDYEMCINQYMFHFLTRILQNSRAIISTENQYQLRNKVMFLEIQKLSQECNILKKALKYLPPFAETSYKKFLNLKCELQFLLSKEITQDTIIIIQKIIYNFYKIKSNL